jgi:tyrosyl-tRNA synthetase
MPNTAQRRLAESVTEFVHGKEGLAQALKATEALRPGAATELDTATLEAIAGDAPSAALPREKVRGLRARVHNGRRVLSWLIHRAAVDQPRAKAV